MTGDATIASIRHILLDIHLRLDKINKIVAANMLYHRSQTRGMQISLRFKH